ncbi:protein VAC14 homolog isoform X2 [Paramacrobiotus metropolitanus]|uniref:protein VAC14 homolog isoform X2 n=1 Tax=Paramacrobiotus metropolitanus TaxID=2943436 RepID=UPI0024460960|nr:protein VAC14 homolog isoform X2 [Paramacrobiotus metropolitanus]
MASDQDLYPLNQNLLRLLTEKIYEKRKTAASEVERMMKEFVTTNNTAMIQKLIKVLAQDLTLSDNGHYRKGGLIGLAAASIALGKHIRIYLPQIIKPVIACFNDADSRIRYFACEALYNVVKVARETSMPYFPEIFDVLSKLCADSDTNTKNGAELLDRLVKDVVIESRTLDLEIFVPLLRERIYAKNPFVKQFLVSWISVLDSAPEVNILDYLPEILDGLFTILSDPRLEIRKACESLLGEFLHGIVTSPQNVDYAAMINILIAHAQSQDELVQFTAILWIKQFIKLSGERMLPFASGILIAVLPCLSFESDSRKNVRENAKQVNQELVRLIPREMEDTPEKCDDILTLDLHGIVDVLIVNLKHDAVPTRLACLRWVYSLFDLVPRRTFKSIDKLFPALLVAIQDTSDEVILATLEVFAELSSVCDQLQVMYKSSENQPEISYFRRFIGELLRIFKGDRSMLEERGHFMIRQLCLLLSAQDIYEVIAEILLEEADPKFASIMVQALSSILLTASELFELRNLLKDFSTAATHKLFEKLYRCWANNSVAAVALCLLTQRYQHACAILEVFADIDVTVEHLSEIDKLIQLIESPVFTYLRMQLLDPASEAFGILQRRLDCIPWQKHSEETANVGIPKNSSRVSSGSKIDIDFEELLNYFRKRQYLLQTELRKARRASNLLSSL